MRPPRRGAGRSLAGRPASKTRAATVWLLLGLGAVAACGPKHPATPEDLRRAWAKSLQSDDPEAAWSLLSPQAQSRIGKEAFSQRWRRYDAERRDQLEAHAALEDDARAPVLAGRTTHPGGLELRWIKLGGDYQVASGLPTQAWTMTAEGTVRAFITELRRLADARLDHLVSPELMARVSETWAARADAMERALERPGAMELSADYDRAVLRFEGGALVLERTSAGWRVLDLR